MKKENELDRLSKMIRSDLHKLESTFWDVFVAPNELGEHDYEEEYLRNDNKTWLYQGTKSLYYKICLFLEMKGTPSYLEMFRSRFESIIVDEVKTMASRAGLYEDSDPSMIIHDEFRQLLSPYIEFDYNFLNKNETNKLKLILENTNSILNKTRTLIKKEKSIYDQVRWFISLIYPKTRALGKARFITQYGSYHPDILIPEISSAVEYKYIRTGVSPAPFLDAIAGDAINYNGDSEYRFFYGVVYYEDKTALNSESFKEAVIERKFPENWTIIAV